MLVETDLPDDLVAKAREHTGIEDLTDLVSEALRALIARAETRERHDWPAAAYREHTFIPTHPA